MAGDLYPGGGWFGDYGFLIPLHGAIVASGGVHTSGTAAIAAKSHRATVATSGVVVSGVASVAAKSHRAAIASGGVVASGVASIAPKSHRTIVAIDGVVVSGVAATTPTSHASLIAAGGVEIGGSAVVTVPDAIVASGGVEIAGAGLVAAHTSLIGVGGVVVMGEADVTSRIPGHATIVADGGVEIAGDAVLHATSIELVEQGGGGSWKRRQSPARVQRWYASIRGQGGVRFGRRAVIGRHSSTEGTGVVEIGGAARVTVRLALVPRPQPRPVHRSVVAVGGVAMWGAADWQGICFPLAHREIVGDGRVTVFGEALITTSQWSYSVEAMNELALLLDELEDAA